ncbi:hypothetical protein C6380_03305 [Pseudomonas syringae pv. actinidiae]|nr:hypothetical protein C6380_03305 [Pseudomonas syringae pv. actinidiae]
MAGALSARSTIVRRRASRAAFPRRACGTIIPTIVRRSASHAVLDALRQVLRSTPSAEHGKYQGGVYRRVARREVFIKAVFMNPSFLGS